MDIGKFTYILTIERLVECFDPPTLLDGKFFSNLQAKKKKKGKLFKTVKIQSCIFYRIFFFWFVFFCQFLCHDLFLSNFSHTIDIKYAEILYNQKVIGAGFYFVILKGMSETLSA